MATNNENIRVVQLTDDNDNPVSPVVNVGSLYDKNGNKVDNLLSYKVAGTNVPVPEIKNVEAALTAKVDAKLAELDAAVTKLEKAAESGAKVTFSAKVKAGETVEKYMPVDVENGECYTGMITGPIQQHNISGKIVAIIDYNTCVAVAVSEKDVIVNVVNMDGADGVVTSTNSVTIPASKTGRYSRTINKVFLMNSDLAYALIYDPNSYEVHYVRIDIDTKNKSASISLSVSMSGKNNIAFAYKQNAHTIMASFAPVGGGGWTWYSFDTDTRALTALTYGGSPTYNTSSDMRKYDDNVFAISDNMALSAHYLYTIKDGNVTNTGNKIGIGETYILCGCAKIGENQYIILINDRFTTFTLYNVVLTADSASTKATLALSGSTSSSYELGVAGMIKADTGLYVTCKNLSTKKLMYHKISYSASTLSLDSSTELDTCELMGSSTVTGQYTCDTIFTAGGAFLITNNANVNSFYNYILRPYKGRFYGSLTPASSGALALNSANAGETVDLLYSGVIKDADVRSGYRLDTRGFTAEAPVDGTLLVTRISNDYSGQTEIVSYTGNGKYGSDNPCQLKFSFKPKSVVLLGVYNGAWDDYSANSIMKTLMIDMVGSSYTQNIGFFAKGSDNSQSCSYCRFDSATNSLYWYNTASVALQLNVNNYVYYAMGIK